MLDLRCLVNLKLNLQYSMQVSRSPDMIHEAGMHLVQKMSASKKAEFLEALKDLKGGMACLLDVHSFCLVGKK